MAKRKTFEIQKMVEYANTQLKRTDEFADKGFKAGVCVMIEKILMKTKNYEGYFHLNPNNCDIDTVGYYSRKYFYNGK